MIDDQGPIEVPSHMSGGTADDYNGSCDCTEYTNLTADRDRWKAEAMAARAVVTENPSLSDWTTYGAAVANNDEAAPSG